MSFDCKVRKAWSVLPSWKGRQGKRLGEGGDGDVEMEGSVDWWGPRRRGGIWYCEAMVAVFQ